MFGTNLFLSETMNYLVPNTTELEQDGDMIITSLKKLEAVGDWDCRGAGQKKGRGNGIEKL